MKNKEQKPGADLLDMLEVLEPETFYRNEDGVEESLVTIDEQPGEDGEEHPGLRADEESEENAAQDAAAPEDAPEKAVQDAPEEDEGSFTPFVLQMVERGVLETDPEKEYDDSEEGLSQIIEDTVSARDRKRLQALPPRLREAVEIALEGGDWASAVVAATDVDYASIDPSDETYAEDLVRDYLDLSEMDAAEAEETIAAMKEAGVLGKQARAAHKQLLKHQETQSKARLEKARAEKEASEKERRRQAEDIQSRISSMERIAGFELDAAERKKFIDYIFTPDAKGRTRLQQDLEKDPDAPIKQAYLLYRKFDFTQVEKKARSEAAGALKKKLSRYSDKLPSSRSEATRERPGDIYIPDF